MPGKLKNIEAIQKMLAGEHRTQTRTSYSVDKDAWKANQESAKIIRKVGDYWTEYNSIGEPVCVWEQCSGYRTRHSVGWTPEYQKMMDDMRRETSRYFFKNCPKETCTCKQPNHLDEKFRKRVGMCFDCVIELDTKKKIHGEFDEYAKDKMRANVQSYFRDLEQQFDEWKESVRNKITYVQNGDGTVEEWSADNPEEMINRLEREIQEFKNVVLNSPNINIDEHE